MINLLAVYTGLNKAMRYWQEPRNFEYQDPESQFQLQLRYCLRWLVLSFSFFFYPS